MKACHQLPWCHRLPCCRQSPKHRPPEKYHRLRMYHRTPAWRQSQVRRQSSWHHHLSQFPPIPLCRRPRPRHLMRARHQSRARPRSWIRPPSRARRLSRVRRRLTPFRLFRPPRMRQLLPDLSFRLRDSNHPSWTGWWSRRQFQGASFPRIRSCNQGDSTRSPGRKQQAGSEMLFWGCFSSRLSYAVISRQKRCGQERQVRPCLPWDAPSERTLA